MERGKNKREWERKEAIGAGVEAEGDRVLGRVNGRMGRGDRERDGISNERRARWWDADIGGAENWVRAEMRGEGEA